MCQYLHLVPKKKGVENVTLVELVWDEKTDVPVSILIFLPEHAYAASDHWRRLTDQDCLG